MRNRVAAFLVVMLGTVVLSASLASAEHGQGKVKKFRVRKGTYHEPSPAIPEPGAAILFGAGSLGVAWVLRRRNRSN